MVSYLLAAVGRRAVRDEAVVEVFIDHHNRRLVATTIAVVGRREDRNTLVGVGPLVALHHLPRQVFRVPRLAPRLVQYEHGCVNQG